MHSCRLTSFTSVLSYWWIVGWGVLVMTTTASALLSAYTDPGILPRGINPRNEITMNGSTDYGPDGPTSYLVYHPHMPEILMGKEITVDGKKVFIKYCCTCELFRPLRASHCSYCDNCVEEYDHHCPWVSNCVGRRNFRYFMHFLIWIAAFLDYTLAIMLLLLHARNRSGLWETLGENMVPTGIIAAAAIPFGVVNYLLLSTLVLVGKDKTVSEYVKHYDHHSGRSCWENYVRVFCSKRPNRHVAWRDYKTAAV